ncbi:MAG TPA: hypothetical protein VIX59_07610 [Candidatus Binataceae bacterium]
MSASDTTYAPSPSASRARAEPWLETIDTDSPLLLIAPHGGRAEPATRSMLNPKVNDLHTADITRELARRLNAAALINAGMDRNRLDCNRIQQLVARAPWLLEMIADRLEQIVERHGHAVVLLIHGWNIIEPRVDFGLGLRNIGGELHPPGTACVSACDEFIHGALAHFAERLREHGIRPSFGLRYPGGGLQNLLQAFTARHRENTTEPLRRIAAIAQRGQVDAAQLELSVALRMPGTLRTQCLDAIEASFASNGHAPSQPRIVVNRVPRPRAVPTRSAASAPVPTPPARVGVEFFDPVTHIGAMASFDIGAGFGARIMMLLGGRRVALFTGEGPVTCKAGRIALGPLALAEDGRELVLRFKGAAVVVPDSSAYLSIERALASGRLDGAAELSARLEFPGGGINLDQITSGAGADARNAAAQASFGRLTGTVSVDGMTSALDAVVRAGMSFTGLGPQKFTARRMIWACFPDAASPSALELRAVATDDGPNQSARALGPAGWSRCEIHELSLETPSVEEAPHQLSALMSIESDSESAPRETLIGHVESFIPLSRPGPDQTRIYTSLGFARFSFGGRDGAGMFEYSRRAETALTAVESDDEGSD